MKTRPGITLIDLLISMAILAIVFTAVYAVFAFQEQNVRAASASRDVYAQGMMILDRITKDLTGVWLRAGARETDNIRYTFTGEEERMDFTTTARLSSQYEQGMDVVEVGYLVTTTTDQADGTYSLVRRQDDLVDGDTTEGGTEIILTSDLKTIEFSFLGSDGQEKDSWETDKPAELPKGVRITLTLSYDQDREEAFSTLVALPLSQPTVDNVDLPSGLESFL